MFSPAHCPHLSCLTTTQWVLVSSSYFTQGAFRYSPLCCVLETILLLVSSLWKAHFFHRKMLDAILWWSLLHSCVLPYPALRPHCPQREDAKPWRETETVQAYSWIVLSDCCLGLLSEKILSDTILFNVQCMTILPSCSHTGCCSRCCQTLCHVTSIHSCFSVKTCSFFIPDCVLESSEVLQELSEKLLLKQVMQKIWLFLTEHAWEFCPFTPCL